MLFLHELTVQFLHVSFQLLLQLLRPFFVQLLTDPLVSFSPKINHKIELSQFLIFFFIDLMNNLIILPHVQSIQLHVDVVFPLLLLIWHVFLHQFLPHQQMDLDETYHHHYHHYLDVMQMFVVHFDVDFVLFVHVVVYLHQMHHYD